MPLPLLPKRIARGAGQVFRLEDEAMWCKASADDTGGAYALFEVATPPGAGGPPRRAALEDVACFVVAGTYALQIGGETQDLQAGAYAIVPRGMRQSYRNSGAIPARMLVLASPGGIFERFLTEVGRPRTDGALPTMGKVRSIAPKYGIEFLLCTDTGSVGQPMPAGGEPGDLNAVDQHQGRTKSVIARATEKQRRTTDTQGDPSRVVRGLGFVSRTHH